jgi:hypothetical protein
VIIDGLQRVRSGVIVAPTLGDMRSRPGESIAARKNQDREEAKDSSGSRH